MHENIVAKVLFIIGVAQITIGIFVGILIGSDYGSWALFFTWSLGGFILGMLFIGFAENIQLLQRIYLKMGGEEPESKQDHVLIEEAPFDPNKWYVPEDQEKIENYYKDEEILEITPADTEGYCIVKLTYDSNVFVRVVDIHGFGVQEVQDEATKNSIITWYNKQP